MWQGLLMRLLLLLCLLRLLLLLLWPFDAGSGEAAEPGATKGQEPRAQPTTPLPGGTLTAVATAPTLALFPQHRLLCSSNSTRGR